MWGKNKAVIIGVIIGLVVGYFFGSLGGDKAKSETENMMGDELTQVADDSLAMSNGTGGSINVVDQVAGTQIRVASVSVSGPTWVTVREDSNGVPGGSILGAALLSTPGTHRDVLVELLVPATPATRYHVNLFADDGDRAFDHRTDQLVTLNGQVLDAAFSTQ